MLLEDLFKRDNVNCPDWLLQVPIDDDWADSVYSMEDNTHKWTLKDIMKHLELCFDGSNYTLTAFHDGLEYLLEQRNEDVIIHS